MSGERPGSLLTPTQRQWLRGEKEYSGEYAKQQRYDRREAIRRRLKSGIDDFALLAEVSDGDDEKLPDISLETWDELLLAVRNAHPDPPAGDADALRRVAKELEEKAERMDN